MIPGRDRHKNGNEEKRVDATASRLSGKLGKLLMPRIGYEKKKNSGGQGGGGGQGGSGGSSRNLTYEFSDFKFKGNDLEIQYCIKMTHSKRDTNIELVIESEGGRIDPISWQRDIGTPYPAMISSVSISKRKYPLHIRIFCSELKGSPVRMLKSEYVSCGQIIG